MVKLQHKSSLYKHCVSIHKHQIRKRGSFVLKRFAKKKRFAMATKYKVTWNKFNKSWEIYWMASEKSKWKVIIIDRKTIINISVLSTDLIKFY